MKKRDLVLLSGIVLFLFIIACTSSQENEPTQVTPERNTLDQVKSQLIDKDCEAEMQETVSNCYQDKAIIFNDDSFCDKVTDPYNQGYSKEGCLAALRDCEEVSNAEERDLCYREKINLGLNTYLTFNLGSQYLVGYCDKVADTLLRDYCYVDVAGFYSEPEICLVKISDQNARNSCYVTMAQRGYLDFAICENIIDLPENPGYTSQVCFDSILQQKLEWSAGFFSDTQQYGRDADAEDYIRSTSGIPLEEMDAVTLSDEKKCNSIASNLAKEGCYIILAVQKSDKTICENIQTVSRKDQCSQFVEAVK